MFKGIISIFRTVLRLDDNDSIRPKDLCKFFSWSHSYLIWVKPQINFLEPIEKMHELLREMRCSLWQADSCKPSLLPHSHSIIFSLSNDERRALLCYCGQSKKCLLLHSYWQSSLVPLILSPSSPDFIFDQFVLRRFNFILCLF